MGIAKGFPSTYMMLRKYVGFLALRRQLVLMAQIEDALRKSEGIVAPGQRSKGAQSFFGTVTDVSEEAKRAKIRRANRELFNKLGKSPALYKYFKTADGSLDADEDVTEKIHVKQRNTTRRRSLRAAAGTPTREMMEMSSDDAALRKSIAEPRQEVIMRVNKDNSVKFQDTGHQAERRSEAHRNGESEATPTAPSNGETDATTVRRRPRAVRMRDGTTPTRQTASEYVVEQVREMMGTLRSDICADLLEQLRSQPVPFELQQQRPGFLASGSEAELNA